MDNHSFRQQQYLFRLKRDRILIHASRLLLLVFFLFFWETASRKQWIDSFIFSSPSLILETFVKMMKEQSLTLHIRITLSETLVSFFLVMGLGILCAVFLWLCPKISRVLEPYLVVLNSLPKSALAPLLIVWLGASEKTIIVSGISVAIFGCILNLYTGFTEISQEKLKLIRTLGGGRIDELFKIVLPSSVPTILSNMKVNIGLCLVGVIIGEFIGARQGLGYLIIYGSQTFKLTWVLMSIVILMIIAMLLYGILNLIERKVRKH
ncbi:MAG: ABC transporter permease [Blautia glucerasea]|nr:ABC transporter permease [Blautia glucerasea]MDY3085544.1 ABC transporter permease [Blautia sp.]